ncbi:uncharacterized protein EI90DRAFT_3045508 [Cantharellus anzutake]|uniref:uncharacterized protein n=1 Tax=Cantharellus anzutake TaxID=1750568 RepID=UPI00190604B1|nr:uncharacterized protein EI90DRAFT_3045508 [Cantharellus anzutake]KAF8336362.1 hypothetical protein EI90DRAFT_3045508 [Cantharellus anzutake]
MLLEDVMLQDGHASPVTAPPNQARERRAPHLPFRRISMNYVPKVVFPTSTSKRSSVTSVLSTASLPERPSERRGSLDSLCSPTSPGSLLPSQQKGNRPMSSWSLGSIELDSRSRGSAVNVRARHASRPKPSPNQSKCHQAAEIKRRKVMFELWETETSYVQGLDLIYCNFLTPLVDSLSRTDQLLSPENLNAIFSNFVDIWNLHLSFQSDLDELFKHSASTSSSPAIAGPDNTSPPPQARHPPETVTNDTPDFHDFIRILLSHFPYLSMYNPFVTSFPHGISLLTTLSTAHRSNNSNSEVIGQRGFDPKFAAWLRNKEAEPVCRKLKLRDWMLTVVQRCPRYLLLIKDLISCTNEKDCAYTDLLAADTLLSKITSTMNEALRSHAQILSLLSLQRNTQNLPFPLITPGRSLLKRSTLVKVDRGSDQRVRDVLLFSDVLVWFSRGEREDWKLWPDWGFTSTESEPRVPARQSFVIQNSGKPVHQRANGVGNGLPSSCAEKPRMVRTRSRSDADVTTSSIRPPKSTGIPVSPTISLFRTARQDETQEEHWFYRGSVEILDVDVVSSPEDDCMFEVMSPHESFALYAGTPDERDSWVDAIRSTKIARMSSVQATLPNTTFTSSTSNKHIRRYLQALPYDPSLQLSAGTMRAKVEHFVPAIWVPDQKMETCMRCQTRFGWRLRRHHCRLCGKVVCATCSTMTFYIHDPLNEPPAADPARACNTCYDSVFPVLDQNDSRAVNQPRPGNEGVLRRFHPSTSMPSLALAITPATTLLPSVSSFNLFSLASFLRSTPSLIRRQSMPGTLEETSTLASSSGMHTPSDNVLGSSDEVPDATDSVDTETDAWSTSHHSRDSIFEGPTEDDTGVQRLAWQISETNADHTNASPPRTRCSSFSGLPQVPEVQSFAEDSTFEKVMSPMQATCATVPNPPVDVFARTVSSPGGADDLPSEPRGPNSMRRTSISPFPTSGPQLSVQGAPVVSQTRPRGDGSHRYSLILGSTIRSSATPARRSIPPSIANMGKYDSSTESAVVNKLAGILSHYTRP